MSGTAAPRGREPSQPFDGSNSDYSRSSSSSTSSSYSYDSSSSSRSSLSSSSSSSSSGDSNIRRRHGRRRPRSRSPVFQSDSDGDGDEDAHRRPRMEDGVLGECGGTVSFEPTSGALPSVLGVFPTLSAPPTRTSAPSYAADHSSLHSVMNEVSGPTGDWPCGVCSNINSQQRHDCYRCGCHYTESLLATPSYEVCVTRLPPDVQVSAVEKAFRQSAPEGCGVVTGAEKKKGIVFAQFASVEEATKYLVSRRCELEVVAAVGSAESQQLRLSFSLDPHPRPKQEDVAAEAARAAEAAEKEAKEAELVAAGVPRFLWPHTWNPPSTFPSLEKHKAFLGTMSAHWEHLSEEQKRYYESEVKAALKQAVSPPEVGVAKAKADARSAVPSADSKSNVSSTTAASPSPASDAPITASTAVALAGVESAPQSSGKTSHALDGLKKRLAERKSALKKAEVGGGAAVAIPSSSASAPSGGALTPTSAANGSTRMDGTPGSVVSGGTSGDFPAVPSCDDGGGGGAVGLTSMQTWGGFPVPLQYAGAADMPQSVELARVPMNVCERLLPPALLQAARMQFR
ncbi:hypothetical protein N2W54_000518 [Lotmaria passim]